MIDGLRIDHIDGLRDPKAYTLRLRDRAARPFHLLVEKILARDETLPADWGTDGTTGYEFTNLLVGLLVDPAGTEALTRIYREFTGRSEPPEEVVRAAKLEIMTRPMAAEVEGITSRLTEIASRDPRRRDLGRGALRTGLLQVLASLGVYRTYTDAGGIRPGDRARLDAAISAARRHAPALDPGVFDFIGAVLTLDAADTHPEERGDILEAAMRFQQLSGPVMAKGLEDTALYRYNRLIALNEVGSEPGFFGLDVAAFHNANIERLAAMPRAMLATSTHDTKRGEDARARIAAISGHTAAWREAVFAWHDMLADPAAPVDRNEEYFFYQLLLGSWPAEWREDASPSPAELAALADRVREAMLKSVREANVNSRWVFGDQAYEDAVKGLVARALSPDSAFLSSFRDFEARIARDGAVNGLIQTVLKLTVPGVPDFYQGAELWEQSLVDPDNRRPVDFAYRDALLARRSASGADALDHDAATKLDLIATLLELRRTRPLLFEQGSYEPLTADGPAAASLCAFVRRQGGDVLFVAVALHPGNVSREDWAGTRLALPARPAAGAPPRHRPGTLCRSCTARVVPRFSDCGAGRLRR